MVKGIIAKSLRDALELRKDSTFVPYIGGTDLMVEADENKSYLFLHQVPEMKNIAEDEEFIRFGAACTFTEIIKNPLSPMILKQACRQIGAPAVRNMGSIGGNIGNGSAKADSALICMVTDSKLRLASADSERIVPIKDFYLGRKKLNLNPDELIIEILMPKHGLENYYHEKVGARKALAISRVSFAGIMDIKNGVIQNNATAFGAVSDVIIRLDTIDNMLIGKTIEEAKKLRGDYIQAIGDAIVPTRGRVGIEYRKDVCINLLKSFLEVSGI
ncbi:MAG: FAD binding domain-containing protein [Defluviitaleaceae bacterium]|nr:FAD binding domain-containing protein [Defluviitaleaceae bacterium]